MTLSQTKQKIEAFAEDYNKKYLGCGCSAEGLESIHTLEDEHLPQLIIRAILFGLELGKEAGPEMAEDTFEGETRYSKGVILGFNEALTEKNAAIQEIIDGLKKLV